ncbi:MAG: hypothetical protein IKW68_00785, partial [Clostridia bacterium]|nr:hypothetical protein [Clostridia bacterium]
MKNKVYKQIAYALITVLAVIGIGVFLLPTQIEAANLVTDIYATVESPYVTNDLSTIKDCHTSTMGVKLTLMDWTDENGVIYPPDTQFNLGETYYCVMCFETEPGYEFPSSRNQLKGYINGIEGEVSSVYYTDTAYVTVPFTVDAPGYVYVAGVPLNDSEYLEVGGAKPTTVKPADNYAYLKDGVLTLHNFSYTGLGYVLPINGVNGTACAAIFTMNPLDIRLEGQNSISIYEEGLDAVAICILHNSDS